MKLEAKSRLVATAPESELPKTGPVFDTLIDGEPDDGEEPEIQTLTKNDGGVETAPEQSLLMDDVQP
jgi:hypothetical protein